MHRSPAKPFHRQLRKAPLIARLGTLAIALAAASAPAFASGSSVAPPHIDWQSCGPGFDGLQCAKVAVPLDYDHPNGPKTELAIARYPASKPSKRIGSLFLNPGGPGGSGVDMILSGLGRGLDTILDGRFDIVGWDPRGIGGSNPIQCWDTDEAREAYLKGQPQFPYKESQELPYYRTQSGIAPLCAARKQAIFSHMSTADVVRDLDLLRQAVGDQRLTYLGYSYGSHIGNTYANMYPRKVRAVVIDGVLNPQLWTSGWQIKADRTASYEVLKQFFTLCDSAGEQCALAGGTGARARYESLLESIRQRPIQIDDGGQIIDVTYDLMIAFSAGSMYSPERWPVVAAIMAELERLAAGDRAAGKRALRSIRALQSEIRAAAPQRATYDNGTEAYLGNHCSDAEYPGHFQAYRVIARYAAAGSTHGPYWWWGNAGCAAWPTAQDRYTGPWVTVTSAPVLVVGNYYDPATDYAGAVASHRMLLNSRLVSYKGWGHVVAYTGRSQCTDEHVTRYLISGTLPPRGATCEAAPNPFLAAAKASARALPRIGLPKLPAFDPR